MGGLLRSTSANFSRNHFTTTTVEDLGDWYIAIEAVEYVGVYNLRLKFTDGHEQLVDFGAFLHQSQNPHIHKYLDEELFQDFTLQDGDLFWHEYDLCFPIADLYEGKI
jgi:DUF971 family protein